MGRGLLALTARCRFPFRPASAAFLPISSRLFRRRPAAREGMLPKQRRARVRSPDGPASSSPPRFPGVAIYLAEPRMGRSRRAFLTRLAVSKGFRVLDAYRCAVVGKLAARGGALARGALGGVAPVRGSCSGRLGGGGTCVGAPAGGDFRGVTCPGAPARGVSRGVTCPGVSAWDAFRESPAGGSCPGRLHGWGGACTRGAGRVLRPQGTEGRLCGIAMPSRPTTLLRGVSA